MPTEPVGDMVENDKFWGELWWRTTGDDWPVPDTIPGRFARAVLSAATSDAERKLAAVRELRDATAALCHPPVPTDDDPMSQGAWAARREVVDAPNALLGGEATS